MLSCATTMMSSFSLQRFFSSSRAAVFGSLIILFPQSCARRLFWGRSFFLSFLFSSLSFLEVLVWISSLSFHKRIAGRRGRLELGGCAEKDGFLRITMACGTALEVLFLLFFLRVKRVCFLLWSAFGIRLSVSPPFFHSTYSSPGTTHAMFRLLFQISSWIRRIFFSISNLVAGQQGHQPKFCFICSQVMFRKVKID